MPSDKTKKLLEGLGKITDSAPKQFTPQKFTVVSNQYGEDAKGNPTYIDRLYCGISGITTLVQKDFSEYKGKIHKKRRLVKTKSGNSFYSVCYHTADGRWFNNSGMPMEAPTNVEEEVAKVEPGFVKRELTDEEKSEIARHNTAREQQLLAKLK
jgi:hypothetical protein